MKIEIYKHYIFLYLALIIYSGVTVFSKLAAKEDTINYMLFVFLIGEIVCLALYALLWQQVLKYFELSVAMANKGIIVIISMIWSVLIFHESISALNIAGAVVIICGIKKVLENV